MAEHDYVLANADGATFRADLNNSLAAIVSNNSKATAPTTTFSYMWWADTANDLLKQRNAADSAWINILVLSTGAPSVNGSVGKQAIPINADGMRAPTTNGAGAVAQTETTAGRGDIVGWAFDGSADEYVQFDIWMPSSWDEGTITAKIAWSSTATDTDGVTWAVQGVAMSDGDTQDVAMGTPVTIDDANQSAAEKLHHSPESGAITIGGSPAARDLVRFFVYRDVSDANDTAVEDAILQSVTLFLTTDEGVDS